MATTSADLKVDSVLRDKLLTFYIEHATGEELSAWLRDISQDVRGSVADKRARVRAHTQYLTMPSQDFPAQTIRYLSVYDSEFLGDICEDLDLNPDGSKDQRYRRIMREVHYREGWLARPNSDAAWTVARVAPFIEAYPILKRSEREKDYYDPFESEMAEVFGAENVHPQLAIAYGTR